MLNLWFGRKDKSLPKAVSAISELLRSFQLHQIPFTSVPSTPYPTRFSSEESDPLEIDSTPVMLASHVKPTL